MRPRKAALLFVAIGIVCLPAPLYLGWAAGAVSPPPQTNEMYVAEPLDPANASDRRAIAERYGGALALSTHRIGEDDTDEYRAPAATRQVLETAMATGSATASDPGVRADLRYVASEYRYVQDATAHREQYHRLRVRANGSRVEATNVTVDRVANATVAETAFEYDDLSPGERRTVDRIVANSSGEESGYRPRVDEPFVDELPALVHRDGTLYDLQVYGHVDDFSPRFYGALVGAAVAVVGVAAIVTGGIFSVYAWWQGDTGPADGPAAPAGDHGHEGRVDDGSGESAPVDRNTDE